MPDERGGRSKQKRGLKRLAERRKLSLERARVRVEERQAAGKDVVAYAL